MPALTNDAYRAGLARSIYTAITQSAESLEHDDLLGPDLAYLLGAILCGTGCEWPPDRPIVQRLRDRFPPIHPVWIHITLDPPEVPMSDTLLLAVLEIAPDRDPDWARARQHLADLTDDALLAQRDLPRSTPTEHPTAEELRAAATHGLELLSTMWQSDHDDFGTVRTLSACRVLIFGGPSWGDEPFEGYVDATFAIDLGLAEAAGFR